MASRLLYIPKTYPFAFGIGFSCAKTSISDLLVQLGIEQKRLQDVDWRRNAAFATFGFFYLGGVQYFIYNILLPRWLFPSAAAYVAKPVAERLKDRAGQITVVKQVALDQFIHHPFILFPCFYCVKEFVERGAAFDSDAARDALSKYRTNMLEDLKACWATWVPAFLFNFSINPLWARIPFVAVVSFGFTTYFSFLRGKPQELKDS